MSIRKVMNMDKKSIKKDIEELLDKLPNLTDEQKEKVQEIRDILNKVPNKQEKNRTAEFYDDRL